MALKQQASKKPSTTQTAGPSMGEAGYNGGPLPVNPSDQIFQGRTLTVVQPVAVTGRRDFSIPVKPTLHYRDGLDGAAETITVNERRLSKEEPDEYTNGVPDLKYPPTQSGDWDHGEFGASAPGREGGSGGPNDSVTLNGVEIRGT